MIPRIFARATVLAALILAAPAVAVRAANDPLPSHYETVVLDDAPVCWWRMTDSDSRTVVNRCSPPEGDTLAAQPMGQVRLDFPGPSGEQFPDFSSDNVAAQLTAGRNYLRVRDPGEHSALDFDNGDALSIEAWIQPSSRPQPKYSYIVGKGRTLNSGADGRNQNYSLRLDNRGSEARLSFFFVDAETPDHSTSHKADGHRWTSKLSLPLDGRWHHVAVSYTFGQPEAIRGYIDGVETTGNWDLAGPTRKRPVVDDDELWIGSSMSGRATFSGAIDEVALYRHVLDAKAIGRHVQIHRRDEVQALVEAAGDSAPSDRVQFDAFEGVSIAGNWNFVPTERQPVYESDVFALTELPRKYDRRAVIVDRPAPLLLHAYARLELPPGEHQLALRSLNGARLYVDGELLAETPFLPSSGNGHGKVYQIQPSQPDRLSLAAAHHEQIVALRCDGTPRVFSLLAVAGLGGRPIELGELVVACRTAGASTFQLLGPLPQESPGASVAYRSLDDEGWLNFLEHDRTRAAGGGSRTCGTSWAARKLAGGSSVTPRPAGCWPILPALSRQA